MTKEEKEKEIEDFINKYIEGSNYDFGLFMKHICPANIEKIFKNMIKSGMEFTWNN